MNDERTNERLDQWTNEESMNDAQYNAMRLVQSTDDTPGQHRVPRLW